MVTPAHAVALEQGRADASSSSLGWPTQIGTSTTTIAMLLAGGMEGRRRCGASVSPVRSARATIMARWHQRHDLDGLRRLDHRARPGQPGHPLRRLLRVGLSLAPDDEVGAVDRTADRRHDEAFR